MQKVPVVSIIDDDASVRVGISSLTRSLGWDAHVFSSAHEFLSSPCVFTSNCVISDVQMPGMSGLDLQQHLIANGNNVPLILITAFGSETIQREALSNGALCFLRKPVDGAKIVTCLQRLVDGKRNDESST